MYMFDLSVGTPEHKFWSVFKGNVSEQESHQCSPLLKCEKSLLSHHLLCILHNVLLPTSTFNLINLHYSRQRLFYLPLFHRKRVPFNIQIQTPALFTHIQAPFPSLHIIVSILIQMCSTHQLPCSQV